MTREEYTNLLVAIHNREDTHRLLLRLVHIIADQQSEIEQLRKEFSFLTDDHALLATTLADQGVIVASGEQPIITQVLYLIADQKKQIEQLRHEHDVWVETCKRLFGDMYDDVDVAAGEDDGGGNV